MKNTYYRVCEFCGSHLDPNERCDCQEMRDYNGDQDKEPIHRGIPELYAVSGMAREAEAETMDRWL